VRRKKMNTKIIVALVLGIALVGLTGAASAAYYHIDGNYIYADGAANAFNADTRFDTEVVGTAPDGTPTHMHSWIDNDMAVTSVSSPNSDVNFALVQGGETSLTIETNLPGNINTFVSTDKAFQQIDYTVNGDAFDIDLTGDSVTHASTHNGILPIGAFAVWDSNEVWNEAWVNYDEAGDPMASIKEGSTGYVCETHVEAVMEAEHVLGPVTAGSGITLWGETHGEIWAPLGELTNDVWGQQDIMVWWP
jgi:hypothetical protein